MDDVNNGATPEDGAPEATPETPTEGGAPEVAPAEEAAPEGGEAPAEGGM